MLVAPTIADYCHCRTCQQLTGTPASVWAQVPIAAFRYTLGEPAIYASSATGERRFCQLCASPIEHRRRPDPTTVEFFVGTLDDPSQVAPKVPIFTQSRIPWFDTTDALPRLQQFS